MRRARGVITLTALTVASALTLTACGGGSSDDSDGGSTKSDVTLSLVGYAVPQPGFAKVIPGFQKTEAGKKIGFNQSYGASGDQSRKVVSGLSADVVAFSVEPDVTRLVKADKVDASWNAGQYKGIGFGSVVSLVVRKGNPKGIKTWDDLLKPGVEVVSPDPRSSGSAKWNLLAPYAAASDGGKNTQAGLDFVSKLVTDHIKARPSSGRDASDLFLQGTGDVLISYENEAINLQRQGKDIEFIDPPVTFRIDNPVAVVKGSHPTEAKAFVDYITSPEGQKLWAEAGFRPVDTTVAAATASSFPALGKVWTIDDLGGWTKVDKDLFDKDNGLLTKLYAKATG
ncbi:sulfate ABC transporter substrate-binding protein [Williamsia sp. CHRR-6]|uniref:sulfate ABC transporter substrate-binding protein n=1 Tax=Williamsia sp. CHRR-6 TaxID=2835871 RepID=UPI001BDB3D88|nr:sulfate ABC transporter substrate-binding protein [Williamsia sp. CHRR-6]MBT0567840.1 sulfate ABC transporter substrate-binding protein [Williamsia sp. CHRR-6]